MRSFLPGTESVHFVRYTHYSLLSLSHTLVATATCFPRLTWAGHVLSRFFSSVFCHSFLGRQLGGDWRYYYIRNRWVVWCSGGCSAWANATDTRTGRSSLSGGSWPPLQVYCRSGCRSHSVCLLLGFFFFFFGLCTSCAESLFQMRHLSSVWDYGWLVWFLQNIQHLPQLPLFLCSTLLST